MIDLLGLFLLVGAAPSLLPKSSYDYPAIYRSSFFDHEHSLPCRGKDHLQITSEGCRICNFNEGHQTTEAFLPRDRALYFSDRTLKTGQPIQIGSHYAEASVI